MPILMIITNLWPQMMGGGGGMASIAPTPMKKGGAQALLVGHGYCLAVAYRKMFLDRGAPIF